MTPAELAAVHAASFTVPAPWDARAFADLLATPGVFLLTEGQGFLLGRAIAGEAEILTLAVHPDARRSGIGARLLGRFLARAKDLGADRAFLEVAETNAPAIALYRAADFTEAGRRRGYFTASGQPSVDALVLSRAI